MHLKHVSVNQTVYDLVTEDEILSLEGRKANAENLYMYKEATPGPVVTVDDAVAEAVKQMKIAIEPVQDLHGYDNPWPGGANTSNLFNESTVEFGKWTSADGSVSAAAGGCISEYIPVIGGNEYGIVFKGETPYSMSICEYDASETFLVRNHFTTGQRGVVTLNASTTKVKVQVYAPQFSITLSAEILASEKVMFYTGSTQPVAYSPYANICPISGWTEAKVTRPGENLLDKLHPSETGYAFALSGGVPTKTANSSWDLSNYMPVAPGYVYDFSGMSITYNSNTTIVEWSDNHKSFISYQTISDSNILTSGATMTAPVGAKYCRVTYKSSDGGTVQFKQEATASAYTPHIDTIYTYSFPTSAGTVYGGTLTVNSDDTGELVVDRAIEKVSNLTWSRTTSYSHPVLYTNLMIKSGTELNMISSEYKVINPVVNAQQFAQNSSNGAFAHNSSSAQLYVRDDAIESVSDFTTQRGNEAFVYYLATPQTYILSAHQVETIIGLNNVWADTGDILSFLYATEKYHDDRYANRIYNTVEDQVVASFADGADEVPLKTLTVGIEPVQDLHGYDNPWPAGGGKNLLNSALFTDAATGLKYIEIDLTPNATYIASTNLDLVDNTANFFFMLPDASPATNTNGVSTGITRSVTTGSDGKAKVGYRLPSGMTVKQYLAKHFQIESGSTATDYAPYSNICPITGWTGAEVTRTGKNLLWKAKQSATMNGITWALNEDGSITANGTSTGRSYIRILIYDRDAYTLPKGTYTYSLTPTGSDYANIKSLIGSYKGTNYHRNICLVESGNNYAKTFTLEDADLYAVFDIAVEITQANKTVNCTIYPQIEVGSTATSYEPYSGETYSITFPESAGTVYGGNLTINADGTGTLVVDRVGVDMGDLDWASWSESGSLLFNVPLPGKTYNRTIPDCISSMYKYKTELYLWSQLHNGEMTGNPTNDRIYVRNSVYGSNEAFKAGMSGEQIVYTLATPQVYTLTALEVIETLKGNNVIFADTGDIKAVDYPADTKLFIEKKISELQALILENISNS